ncbi:hypothetical protein HK098_001306 [Nowakowskiella sp. JEL0407]|nr:hypothetical protein HK098_001306 [Nowakowskiella sp. JEL0407]
MTVDSLIKHSNIIIRECKDLAKFLQAIQRAHFVYAKNIGDACKEFEEGTINGQVHSPVETSVWNVLGQMLQDYEHIASTNKQNALDFEKSVIIPFIESTNSNEENWKEVLHNVQKVINRFTEASTLINQTRAEYDDLLRKAETTAQTLSRFQVHSENDQKEFERLQAKAHQLLEITLSASEKLDKYEIEKSKAKEDYLCINQDELFKEAARVENSTIRSIHKVIRNASTNSKLNIDQLQTILANMTQSVFKVDIDEDMSEFKKLHKVSLKRIEKLTAKDEGDFTQSAARNLLNVQKSKKVVVKKGDFEKTPMESRYMVLLSGSNEIQFFPNENSEICSEKFLLKDIQVFPVDDSYFGKPNCFQIVPKQSHDNTHSSNTNNAEKKRKTSAPNVHPPNRFQNLSTTISKFSWLPTSDSEPPLSINLPVEKESSIRSLLRCDEFFVFAESARDKADWLNILRSVSYCCEQCASMYGFRGSPKNANPPNTLLQIVATNGETYQPSIPAIAMRRVQIWVMEAKDLNLSYPNRQTQKTNLEQSFGSNLNLNFAAGPQIYCILLLDDFKQAKTTLKSENQSFWGEDFLFCDIAPCVSKLTVLIMQASGVKNQKDLEIGYLHIVLKDVRPGKKVEDWHDIKSVKDGVCIGNIRLAVKLKNELKLPPDVSSRFLAIALDPSLTAVKVMNSLISQQREAFAGLVVNILIAHNRHIDGLKELLTHEIQLTENENIIFRESTVATKALDQFMKIAGREYLTSILGPIIKSIYKSQDDCEVDPLRLSSDNKEQVKRQWKNLFTHVVSIWDAISSSFDKCPRELVELFSHIKNIVSKKFPANPQVKYCAISGFIFLRFFCPAILSPKLFYLMNEHPDPNTARTLTLIAKILQNLANLTTFGNKEPYMVNSNSFIEENIPMMTKFIDKISTVESTKSASSSPLRSYQKIDLNHEIYTLHSFFSEVKPELANQHGQDPTIRKLIPIIEELDNFISENAERQNRFESQASRIAEGGSGSDDVYANKLDSIASELRKGNSKVTKPKTTLPQKPVKTSSSPNQVERTLRYGSPSEHSDVENDPAPTILGSTIGSTVGSLRTDNWLTHAAEKKKKQKSTERTVGQREASKFSSSVPMFSALSDASFENDIEPPTQTYLQKSSSPNSRQNSNLKSDFVEPPGLSISIPKKKRTSASEVPIHTEEKKGSFLKGLLSKRKTIKSTPNLLRDDGELEPASPSSPRTPISEQTGDPSDSSYLVATREKEDSSPSKRNAEKLPKHAPSVKGKGKSSHYFGSYIPTSSLSKH